MTIAYWWIAQSLWGLASESVLMEYADLVLPGPILDLGVGEGRNALVWALMGYEVEGVDISPTAVEQCRQRANDADLSITLQQQDFRSMDITPGRYSLIIAAWVLNFLKLHEIMRDGVGLPEDKAEYIVGPWLTFDPATERHIGDHAEEANALLKDPNNPGFQVPDISEV